MSVSLICHETITILLHYKETTGFHTTQIFGLIYSAAYHSSHFMNGKNYLLLVMKAPQHRKFPQDNNLQFVLRKFTQLLCFKLLSTNLLFDLHWK